MLQLRQRPSMPCKPSEQTLNPTLSPEPPCKQRKGGIKVGRIKDILDNDSYMGYTPCLHPMRVPFNLNLQALNPTPYTPKPETQEFSESCELPEDPASQGTPSGARDPAKTKFSKGYFQCFYNG